MNPLGPLFEPKSIALIGASHTETRLGGVVLKNLLRFKGKVYPVNPKYDELMGIRVVSGSICRYPRSRRPRTDPEACPGSSWNTQGVQGKGEVRDRDEFRICRGWARLHSRTRWGASARNPVSGRSGRTAWGFIIPTGRSIHSSFRKRGFRRPKRGNVAIVSQSGAILSCLLGAVRDANAGVSKAIGYGNAVDVAESDLYDYLAR